MKIATQLMTIPAIPPALKPPLMCVCVSVCVCVRVYVCVGCVCVHTAAGERERRLFRPILSRLITTEGIYTNEKS